jgi:predicted nuclease of restriction endonuclease-like (RecB) superfamily
VNKKRSPKKGPIVKEISRPSEETIAEKLFFDIRSLIDSAKIQVAITVNFALTLLYWRIGKRLREDVLGQERAAYGKSIVATVSQQLAFLYGKGFSREALFRMLQFADQYPDAETVKVLSQQLTWSHFVELITIEDKLKRDFYTEMCRIERWSVRTLRAKTDSMLYERTSLSKKPTKLAKQELLALREEDRLTPDLVFQDPYFLNFLGLKDTYSEKDLESAILRELERFLMELGTDFTFVARQKRLTIGKTDYYIDLLFYHRRLHCLVAVELKLGKFHPADKGQMEIYLKWLEKYDIRPGENPPIGLILCGGKDYEEIELLQLANSGIRVAEYMTELPPREILENKLRQMIEFAHKKLDSCNKKQRNSSKKSSNTR